METKLTRKYPSPSMHSFWYMSILENTTESPWISAATRPTVPSYQRGIKASGLEIVQCLSNVPGGETGGEGKKGGKGG